VFNGRALGRTVLARFFDELPPQGLAQVVGVARHGRAVGDNAAAEIAVEFGAPCGATVGGDAEDDLPVRVEKWLVLPVPPVPPAQAVARGERVPQVESLLVEQPRQPTAVRGT